LSPEVPAAGLWSRIWVMRKAHKQLSEKGYRFCAGHLTCRGAAQQATTGRIIFRGVCMPSLNAADLPAFFAALPLLALVSTITRNLCYFFNTWTENEPQFRESAQ
jgi:hypothetical protein